MMEEKIKDEMSSEEEALLRNKMQSIQVEIREKERLLIPENFSVEPEILPQAGNTIVLSLLGELIESNIRYLYENCLPYISELDRVFIGCAGVTNIDLSGFSVLLDFFIRSKKEEKYFVLLDPSAVVMEKVKASGLEKAINIRQSSFYQTDQQI